MKTLSIQKPGNAQLLFDHFYIGFAITAFYIFLSPRIIAAGYPGFAALLAAEIFILLPLVTLHLAYAGYLINGKWSMQGVILFQNKIGWKKFLLWMLIGIVAILLVYVPLYPIGLELRRTAFAWLPEWYFNPSFGTDDITLVAKIFIAGMFIDGFIGPTLEEFFFRGYLLPRMKRFGHWAPILNGACFGLYHFWQPHNMLAIVAVGIILSLVVWKTKNVWLGVAIHCLLNVLGAVGGYMAVINGEMIAR